MELFLHIGSHKAGSTSIQSFLEKNSKTLEESACAVPDFLNYKNNWQLAAWAGYPKNAHYYTDILCSHSKEDLKIHAEQFGKVVKTYLEEKKRSGNINKLIISSEALYSQCSSPAAIQKIAELTMPFFEKITLIFYYRKQTKLVKSVYAQLVKGPSLTTSSYNEFISTIYDDKIYNYFATVDQWAQVFGNRNIEISEISRETNLTGKRLIEDFLEKIKEPNKSYTLTIASNTKNQSPNFRTLNILRYINMLVSRSPLALNYNSKIIRISHYLAKKLPFKGDFTTSFDAEIEKHFAESNKNLIEQNFTNSTIVSIENNLEKT
ncbi:hypothetical protein [Brumicola pallidula]|jgi:hypothetical protein|uniref:Sulfotransferase domain-containing protein n=1 Tax=Brumicola pallidula DSM 14239 = ACAM 615 TaxID=1121922 RepID=K6YAI7_9ALTE|nr:hypothetical protein [Glaciecola pallidula]GAC29764.1 hypothetical protein GPAL_2913 [Glaciecola pallidula DSM 14239 = ACAM 615]